MANYPPEKIAAATIRTDDKIGGFFGEYRFLSNFELTPVLSRGRHFPSTEHAFMYAKLEKDYNDVEYNRIVAMSCAEVKAWGRTVKLRPYWDQIKYGVMFEAVLDKFHRNPELRQKLLETGRKELEETNFWGDSYWGVDLVKGGENNLGKILMEVRDILRSEKP